MEQFLKLLDTGFTLAFAVGVCVFVFKYTPLILKAWVNFNKSIDRNTEITNRHYDETVDLKKQLLDLKEKLEHHNSNAMDLQRDHDEIIKNQEEMLKIIAEMKQIILGGGKRYD